MQYWSSYWQNYYPGLDTELRHLRYAGQVKYYYPNHGSCAALAPYKRIDALHLPNSDFAEVFAPRNNETAVALTKTIALASAFAMVHCALSEYFFEGADG